MTFKGFFLNLFQLDGARDVNTAAPEPEVLKPIRIKKIAMNPTHLGTGDFLKLKITSHVLTVEGKPTTETEDYDMGEINKNMIATHAVRYDMEDVFGSPLAVGLAICGDPAEPRYKV